jgi:histidine triad (HIT) family protein
MNDIPEHVASKMFPMAQKMNKTIRDLGKNDSSFQIEAVNLFLADGIEAGQTVYHSHLHVIPRFKGDGFKFNIKYPEKKSDEANDKLASALRSLL